MYRLVEGDSVYGNTSWEVSAGNLVRQHGNWVWGGDMKMPRNEFYTLSPLVASLLKWKGCVLEVIEMI